jgi:phosphohistidine phosphatase
MELILMRHGKALDMGTPGIRCDADRPLSDEGRRVTGAVAEALCALENRPALVLTSPLKRAVETAAIVSERCGDPPVHDCSALAPGGMPSGLVDALRRCGLPCVVAVGHMPDLSELACYLVCGLSRAGLVFETSGACLIRFEGMPRADTGALEWLAPPRILTHAGRD